MPQRGKIAFAVGGKVEVFDNNKWYTAKIVAVNSGEEKILVHFEGWNERYDSWYDMDSDEIRSSKSEKSSEKKQTDKKSIEFKVGDYVLAKWIDCRRYPAKIQQVNNDGTYQVLFDDGVNMTVQGINVKAMDSTMRKQYARKIPTKSKRNGKTIYKCPECSKAFRKQALVDSHIKHIHSSQQTIDRSAKQDLGSPDQKKRKTNLSTCSELSVGNDEIAKSEEQSDEDDYEEEVVNCACMDNEENGLIIQCESCFCWQHTACLGYQDIPTTYYCYVCLNCPRVRESQRYAYDQEWLKKGHFPSLTTPSKVAAALRASTNEISANLINIGNAITATDRQWCSLLKRKLKKPEENIDKSKETPNEENQTINDTKNDTLPVNGIVEGEKDNEEQTEQEANEEVCDENRDKIIKELQKNCDLLDNQLTELDSRLAVIEKASASNNKFNVLNSSTDSSSLVKLLQKHVVDLRILKKIVSNLLWR